MKSPNDGGPIAAGMELRQINGIQELTPVGGLTIRDWFAGMALQGLCANPNLGLLRPIEVTAYDWADAMLSARERKEES